MGAAARQVIALAGNAHKAAQALHDKVISRHVCHRAGLPKAGNGAVHQPWVDFFERFIAQAIARHVTDFIVLYEDVGFFCQLPDNRLRLRVGDIECERFFTAVGGKIISSLGGVITRFIFQKRRAPASGIVTANGALNFDHVRAHIGK